MSKVGYCLVNRQRGSHRALGIVLMRHRRAKQRHHGVSDELLYRPAITLQLPAQQLVVGH
jgi:hypothetical protein